MKSVTLIINGKEAARTTVTIPANGRATAELHIPDLMYGLNRAAIMVEGNDVLSADNIGRFVIRRLDPQRVLFVREATDERSPLYFGSALNAASRGAFVLQSLAVSQTTDLDPSKFAFIVLSDVTSLPAIFEHSLEQYLAKGGNVLMALGLNASRQGHMHLWSNTTLKPHSFVTAGGTTVGQIDFTHPALRQDHPGRDNGGWAETKVLYSVAIDPKDARVAARLSDGTPLLLDKQIGEGHLLLLTTGLDNLSNDIPLHPIFVAFVDKASRYLSGNEQLNRTYVVDSFVQLRSARAGEQSTNVEVIDPDGHRPLSLSEAKTVQTFRLSRAGYYQLHSANGRDAVVAVTTDRRESDLAQIPKEMQTLWVGSNEAAARAEENAATTPKLRSIGLWWYVMLLALVVAVAESLLSSRYLGTLREEL